MDAKRDAGRLLALPIGRPNDQADVFPHVTLDATGTPGINPSRRDQALDDP